jgi:hypothetical protein
MSEGLKIALTALTGIVVFVIGQVIQKLLIEPIQEQKKAISEILFLLSYYDGHNEGIPWPTEVEIRDQFRRAASKLYSTTSVIALYTILTILGFVPHREAVGEINKQLSYAAREVNYKTISNCYRAVIQELTNF